MHGKLVDDQAHLVRRHFFDQIRFCGPTWFPFIDAVCTNSAFSSFQIVIFLPTFYSNKNGSFIPAHSSGTVFPGEGDANGKNIFNRAFADLVIVNERNACFDFLPNFKSTKKYRCGPICQHFFGGFYILSKVEFISGRKTACHTNQVNDFSSNKFISIQRGISILRRFKQIGQVSEKTHSNNCLLYTSPSP